MVFARLLVIASLLGSFSIILDSSKEERITADGRTDGTSYRDAWTHLKSEVITDRPTDIVNYRVACTRLKTMGKEMDVSFTLTC